MTCASVGKSRSLQVLVARDIEGRAHRREHLGLLHGVDAEVGFEVEIQVEHVLRDSRSSRRRSRGPSPGWRRRWERGGCGSAAGCGGRSRGGLQVGPAVVHELDHVRQSREIAQLEVRVARDVVRLADGGEHLGLLHGVDAEVGFEVEIQIEHVLRIAGLLDDDVEDLAGSRPVGTRRRARYRRGAGAAAATLQVRAAIVHEPDDVRQGREVAQLQVLVARDVVGLADGREHLRLLDGVDAEVGFQVEIEVEHVLG